jgi:membrane protein DedA with SNARE-associated domain
MPDGDIVEEAEELLRDVEEDAAALRAEAHRTGWFRLDYAIVVALGLLFGAYFLGYFVFGVDLDALKTWGYPGIFFLAMSGSATVVLPTPSNIAIFSGGIVLDPILGIPAPICVGVIAGLGDAIGEFSGYALGLAGADVVRRQRIYDTFERWMRRRGMLTIFLLCTFPNPFFDLAGAAAGATRMPPGRFFLAALGGKVIKDVFLAYGGSFSFDLVQDLV